MKWKTNKEKMEDLKKFLDDLEEKKRCEQIERNKREDERKQIIKTAVFFTLMAILLIRKKNIM
ncbi:MAG: hypothetical protein LBT51_08875 [Fusobacteriaceae bacterium]|jgi:hypothetical protein|nr:hypothetical protein [Fusobacteriaceae bacterium]